MDILSIAGGVLLGLAAARVVAVLVRVIWRDWLGYRVVMAWPAGRKLGLWFELVTELLTGRQLR